MPHQASLQAICAPSLAEPDGQHVARNADDPTLASEVEALYE
jgi:hypothetical protein